MWNRMCHEKDECSSYVPGFFGGPLGVVIIQLFWKEVKPGSIQKCFFTFIKECGKGEYWRKFDLSKNHMLMENKKAKQLSIHNSSTTPIM